MIIHPCETIKEHMNFLGLDSSDLEAKTGVISKTWDALANGWLMIDFEIALNLEKAFAPSAEFWLNLEHNYQMAKLEEGKRLTELSHNDIKETLGEIKIQYIDEIKRLKKELAKAEEEIENLTLLKRELLEVDKKLRKELVRERDKILFSRRRDDLPRMLRRRIGPADERTCK